MVPVVDLSRRGSRFASDFGRIASNIASSGQLLLGSELAAFEGEFAASLHAHHAVGVASGASALQLALTAAGVGPGHDVIVPAFTAVPTASAVIAAGARPVLADVDVSTACVTLDSIERVRTANTRAVIAVSLYGFPTPLPSMSDGLVVIEDAAQSSGGPGRPTEVTAAAYSFYPTKNLGGIGDGGAIVTNDDTLADTARRLRAHGMVAQYVHTEVSQNFRMSELESAWLRLGLRELAADVSARRHIADRYREAAPHLRWQTADPSHAYHLCVFRTATRDSVREHLAAAGVSTGVHYPLALTQQPAYQGRFSTECPSAERWAAECVSVPCFPEMTDAEIELVSDALAALPADRGDGNAGTRE
ncbi:MAG TPA: DegT/DnrJ/EryC1/StrS family aminotransferase [Ilumatobacter sp.]|nr:DegT/DnrJ/EryC1/StrS family aminotransferase [Ilumatobacter sp.]